MAARRDLKEWLMTVKVGRNVRYVVVEGRSDEAILTCFAEDPQNIDIADVGKIDIRPVTPPTTFLGGNRMRLWDLAQRLESQGSSNAVCLLDRDFEFMFSCCPRHKTIVFTDFANLPAGFMDKEFVGGFLLRAYNISLKAQDWEAFCSVFRRLFALRYWKAISYPDKPLPDVADYISSDGQLIVLDWAGLTMRIAAVLKQGASVAAIRSEVEEIERMLAGDTRMFLHSDDAFNILHRYLKHLGRIANTVKVDSIRAALLGAMAQPRPGQDGLISLIEWMNKRKSNPLP